jgi:ubiquinone/menaquinone biosynthesis C-methylase UbiE
MTRAFEIGAVSSSTSGGMFHAPLAYDVLLRLVWRGSERTYRERVLDLARVRSGGSLLDVGCGTGTLAIAAIRRVGRAGAVSGIDASAQMLARARSKAANAGVAIDFRLADAEALPFANGAFDVVLGTTVLHCLPRTARARCIEEMIRVARPGGRVLLIDFGGPRKGRRSWMARLGPHGRFDLREIAPLLSERGLTDVEQGAVGFSDLEYARAVVR